MRGVGPGERPGHPTLVRVSASVRAGDRLGPYLIDGLIGRGGMGVVLIAEDDSLGRQVALKILTEVHKPRRVEALMREAR